MSFIKNKWFKLVSLGTVLILSIYVVLVFLGVIYITPVGKIIDPDNPEFDPLQFNLYDYNDGHINTYERTCEVVKKLIKPEMSLIETERILVDSGNAYKVLNEEYRRTYLNPIEIGRYTPLIIYSKNYQAQIFIIQYTSEKKVKDGVVCSKVTGPMARNIYESARKRGKLYGTDIYR